MHSSSRHNGMSQVCLFFFAATQQLGAVVNGVWICATAPWYYSQFSTSWQDSNHMQLALRLDEFSQTKQHSTLKTCAILLLIHAWRHPQCLHNIYCAARKRHGSVRAVIQMSHLWVTALLDVQFDSSWQNPVQEISIGNCLSKVLVFFPLLPQTKMNFMGEKKKWEQRTPRIWDTL